MGQVVEVNLTAVNRGDPVRHLVLDSVTGCRGDGHPVQGPGNPYDFGPLARGAYSRSARSLHGWSDRDRIGVDAIPG